MGQSEEVPKRLADFEVIRRLGVGGMAEVFLAKKRGAEGTHKLLVVKRILPMHVSSRRFRTMFAEEAQLATRLNHPNIVQVYDFQDYGDDGKLLSMEYVEGPDLRKLLRAAKSKRERFPPHVTAFIVAEVAKGLHYAHERKDERGAPMEIVHRDVSPQNVLISFEGSVKLADFGIASANLFREEPGVLKGKTAFMSPEQARGEKADRRTDIYSLGVVFHEALTGRPMHGAAEGDELLDAVRAGHVEPPSTYVADVPAGLEAIVMKALARDPDERYPTTRDMAAAISRELFRAKELVDSHVLEVVLERFVSRDHTSPGFQAPQPEGPDADQSELASSVVGDDAAVLVSGDTVHPPTGTGRASSLLRQGTGREVRHVAVVKVHLHGLDELEEKLGPTVSARLAEQLRATLGEIAFKRGARWSWFGADEEDRPTAPLRGAARAVVGLMANPTRAAADAVWLAVDLHEAIQGAFDDQPVKLFASVGIVRGIASGRRDSGGHLVNHQLQEPAEHLADLLGERAPAGASWVAGGLYRLVRRDFLWGDAPTIALDEGALKKLPRHMRTYALLRPLSRQEKMEQAALAAGDLVGRDTELADLMAAYYGVVGQGSEGALMSARVLIGEMGIGKTALASKFLNDLPPDVRVLRIECSPSRSEVPYANVSDCVRELTGVNANDPLEEVKSRVGEALGEFAVDRNGPEIIQRMAELATGKVVSELDEADAARFRRLVASGIRRFFTRAAVEAPLVVMFDGVQWADFPSLELLTDLVRRKAPLPVLALLVTRPDDRIEAFVDGLVRIDLKGIGPENQIRLLEAHLGVTEGVAAVCGDLLPRAGGNPLFVIEMVDAFSRARCVRDPRTR